MTIKRKMNTQNKDRTLYREALSYAYVLPVSQERKVILRKAILRKRAFWKKKHQLTCNLVISSSQDRESWKGRVRERGKAM